MPLLDALFRRKKPEEVFDPEPGVITEMPARPYRVLHADLPFYSDPQCTAEVCGARLIVIRSEDPRQDHHPVECVPCRKNYRRDQILLWDINHKKIWDQAWYINPDTGQKEKAWMGAVEFIGKVYANHP